MVETVAYTITLTILALKIRVIMFRADEIQHVVRMAQENFFIHGTELSTENRKIIKNTMKLARKITVAYATMTAFAWVMFLLSPLASFDAMPQTQNTTNISSDPPVHDLKLPIQCWTPLDVTRSPQYEIVYMYVAVTGCVCSLTLVGVESLCMTGFVYLAGQFELLCDSIRNASEKVKYRLDKRRKPSAGSVGINRRLQFASDKKTNIQYSRANTGSVSSAKGKGNVSRHTNPVLCSADRAARIIFEHQINTMHCLSSLY
jgi:hypothetical protein